MSTSIQARQPAGRPTGGQFASTEHAESDVTLGDAAARPAELEGWPESLPVPTIDFGFLDDGQIETWVKSGDHEIALLTTDYDRGRVQVEVDAGSPFDDESVSEQAKAWAIKAHQQFEDELRQEMEAAATAARHRIAAKITGSPTRLDDEEMSAYRTACFSAGDNAVVEGERASISLFARGILAQYPDADSVELSFIEHEAGTSFTAFTVFDKAGNELGVSERCEDEEDEHLWDLAYSLDTDSGTWDHFAPSHESSAGPSIDLRRAANWTPGARP